VGDSGRTRGGRGGVPATAVRWARLVFVDVFGGAHAVLVPADRLDHAFGHGSVIDGSALEGRSRHIEVDMLLMPDPASVVEWGDGDLRVACSVVHPDGTPWPADPRTALAGIVGSAGEVAEGYEVAAELEFYLLDADGVPVDHAGYFAEITSPGSEVTTRAAERLGRYGIEVVNVHAEAGAGQYELDLGPLAPVAAADSLVLAKAVLREVAGDAGLVATFMPRPLPDEPGSGLHLHQHLGRRGWDDHGRLDAFGQAVVAGQLAHARGLAALAAPNVNSYKRLHAGPEAPGPVVWGRSNRASVIRVAASVQQRASVEFRLADPAANPYLLIGGLLACAAHGVEEGMEPGPSFEEDGGGYDPVTAQSVAVRLLPRHLDDALDALLADDVLVDAFDGRLLSRLVDGRRAEAEAYRSQVTAWEVDRYLSDA
jgi:glutamine synthetase